MFVIIYFQKFHFIIVKLFSIKFYLSIKKEATKAIKQSLGEYYLFDSTPIIQALYRAFTKCKYIEDNDKIAYYKH